MTRKLYKILVVLGIGGITLFQAGSCDYLADQFMKGFEIGLNGGDLADFDCSTVDDIWEVDSFDYEYSCELW